MRSDRELDFAKLYIFGAGGHGREVAWLASTAWRDAPQIEFLVDDRQYANGAVDGHPVGLLRDAEFDGNARFVVAIGDPALRRRIAARFDALGASAAVILHPAVELSDSVSLGEGAIIFPGCTLTTDVVIGKHAHVNAGCTVSHSSRVGNFSSLSPGVHLAGNVHVGDGVFVGVGANVINGTVDDPVIVGDGAVVAAGACVIGPVPSGAMVAGVPAVRKR